MNNGDVFFFARTLVLIMEKAAVRARRHASQNSIANNILVSPGHNGRLLVT